MKKTIVLLLILFARYAGATQIWIDDPSLIPLHGAEEETAQWLLEC